MRKVIFTSIVGNEYNLNEPIRTSKGWDYLCFTDRTDLKSDVWEIINIDDYFQLDSNPRKFTDRQKSRIPKILFNDAKYSVYIDAKFRPVTYLNVFLNKTVDSCDIGLLHHFKRSSIYEEMDEVVRLGIERKTNLVQQRYKYINEDFPGWLLNDTGEKILYAPGIMVRKHTKKMEKFQELWWEEYMSGTERDIISLNYILWRYSKIKIHTMRFKQTYRRFKVFKEGKKCVVSS